MYRNIQTFRHGLSMCSSTGPAHAAAHWPAARSRTLTLARRTQPHTARAQADRRRPAVCLCLCLCLCVCVRAWARLAAVGVGARVLCVHVHPPAALPRPPSPVSAAAPPPAPWAEGARARACERVKGHKEAGGGGVPGSPRCRPCACRRGGRGWRTSRRRRGGPRCRRSAPRPGTASTCARACVRARVCVCARARVCVCARARRPEIRTASAHDSDGEAVMQRLGRVTERLGRVMRRRDADQGVCVRRAGTRASSPAPVRRVRWCAELRDGAAHACVRGGGGGGALGGTRRRR